MLSHGNLTSNSVVENEHADWRTSDIYLSFLPLAHVTARHLDYVCFLNGVCISYWPSFEMLPSMFQEVQPTIIVAVPRVYEKVRQEIEHFAAFGIKHKLLKWAEKVGEKHKDEISRGETPKNFTWKLANRLVFSKASKPFGGRSRAYYSGGAPLGQDLAEWFCCMGVPIFEGYGLTETSPVLSVNRSKAFRIGSVGKKIENVEIKIAEDGEILAKGPSVFKGYWNLPEETKNAFTPDGWFKTGDIGTLDADGFLYITDRKKDLIKTSGGKFIAPQPIENALKHNPLIAEAVVVGDKRRFPAVLIVPNFTALEAWSRDHSLATSSREE